MKYNEEDLREYLKNSKEDLQKGRDADDTALVLQSIKSRLLEFDSIEHVTETFNGPYADFLRFLLNDLNSKWYRALNKTQETQYFDVFFLEAFPEEAFVTLMRVIAETDPCNKVDKALSLMKDFLKSLAIRELFIRQCQAVLDPVSKEIRREIWKDLISYLVSLPERVTNKMQRRRIDDIFSPSSYFANMADVITWCLSKLHELVRTSVDCSMEFLSRIFGRSCLAGRPDAVMLPLMAFLSEKGQNDFIWRRISQRLLAGVPDNCLETVMTFLFRTHPWYKTISHLLGNAALENPKLNFLVTHKLLLVRCFEDDLILQNIFGYLADSSSHRKTLIRVLLNVLEVWGNKSNLKHRQYVQQVYITKAVLIGIGHLNEEEKAKTKEAILEKLMHAMDSHLSSPLPQIRKLGMVTAKCVSQAINPDGPHPEFEFERDEEVRALEALLKPPTGPNDTELVKKIHEVPTPCKNLVVNTECETKSDTTLEAKFSSEELDSDDDEDELKPYDMSNDTPLTKTKKPSYLRDCMRGLVEQDDPDLVEASLEAVEPLIRSNAVGLSDVAVELAKILLHLQDSFAIDNYVALRFGALTAVTVACPKLVAEFLGEQFYDRNYNMRQRLDVLEVLVAAAKEISQAKHTNVISKTSNLRPSNAVRPLPTTENWKEILQKRIESKTRRFAKGSTKPPLPEVANRFSDVAGYFFFPLLHSCNRHENTFDLLGNDFFLLGRLLFSLAMILHAAINTNIAMEMSKTLTEFLWTLRYHTEAYVRRAIIFGLSMMALSVPSHFLQSCLQENVFHWQEWLQDIITKDADIECKQMAAQALAFLDSTIRGVS